MRKAGLVVALIVLAVLVLVLSRSGRVRDPMVDAQAPAGGSRDLDVELSPPPLDTQPPSNVRAASTTDSEHHSNEVEQADDSLRLTGTIVAIDDFGREHANEDGSFAFGLQGGDSGTRHIVEVKAGRWSTAFPRMGFGGEVRALGMLECRLGRRIALLEQGQDHQFALPEDGRLDLRVRWLPVLLLHVRSRSSGEELAGIFLYELPATEFGSTEDVRHPGPKAYASGREVGPSPVALAAQKHTWIGPRVLYAKSPGFAWGRIEIDPTQREEDELLLDPAGELELVVVGEERVSSTRLRLFDSDTLRGRPFLDVPLESTRSLVLEDLPVGRYTAEAQLSAATPTLVGSVEAEVLANRRTTAVLNLGHRQSMELVPFEGVVVLPEEWGRVELLHLELLDTPLDGNSNLLVIRRSELTAEGSKDAFRWIAPAVQPGRYRVTVNPPLFSKDFDVGAGGRHDARIEVPPPCFLVVRCFDEATRETIDRGMVQVVPRAGGQRSGGATGIPMIPEKRWEGYVPQGWADVSWRGTEYEEAAKIVQLGTGTNEVVLQLHPPMGIRLILRDGEKDYRWEDVWKIRLEPLEGQDPAHSESAPFHFELHAAAPGLHRLVVPAIPGFACVPDETIRVDYGIVREHRIALRRVP